MKRAVERLVLKLRGIDLNEMEREWREMDEAKRRREAERERAEAAARRRYVDMRIQRSRGGG
jgi:hypothetical protein